MHRPIHRRIAGHLRGQAVGYAALFVALGGTAAAFTVPRNSVGAAQLRNHSITPVKFDTRAIGGSVKAWATVDANGHLSASSSPARVNHGQGTSDYVVQWAHKLFADTCVRLATVQLNSAQGAGYAAAGPFSDGVDVETFTPQGQFGAGAAQPFWVAVVC